MNPWLLNWRTLATDVPCHLQEWLRPLPRAAFPPSLLLEESEEEECDAPSPLNTVADTTSSGTPACLSRLIVGDLANRATHSIQVKLEEQVVIALLGLRLTPCQMSILRLLLAHPLLSDEELAALLHLQRRSVSCSLYELHQLGCLEPIPTEALKRWYFCGRGLRLIAATNRMHIRNIAVWPDNGRGMESAAMMQHGEAWL